MIELLQILNNHDTNVPCMQHNNALTLYCLTERKALCVNCTYGDVRHKMHRVLPLKDSISHIEKDNVDLEKIISDKILKID